jgi:anti-anti-sigma regulatory factor
MNKISTGRLDVTFDDSAEIVQITMRGQIDERAKLVDLIDQFGKQVCLDLESVSFINSVGVREWIRMMRELKTRGITVKVKRCSEAMVHQMNMIVEAKGNAEVVSFFAPYLCDHCGFEGSMCLEVTPNIELFRSFRAPTLDCPECKEEMDLNELNERYFLFLEDSL